MTAAVLPKAGDRAFPRHMSRGTHAVVLECSDDFVKFMRVDPGAEPYTVVNRLSTFIDRFEIES